MRTRPKIAAAAVRTRLQEKGLKLTPQRYAIYEMLARSETHPTVDELYQAVKQVFPMLSLNTVYYTLSALKDAGLLAEAPVRHAPARFDANMEIHHHLVCLGCGKLEDVYDESLDRLTLRRKNARGYEIRSHRVEFRGYCGDCRNRKQTAV